MKFGILDVAIIDDDVSIILGVSLNRAIHMRDANPCPAATVSVEGMDDATSDAERASVFDTRGERSVDGLHVDLDRAACAKISFLDVVDDDITSARGFERELVMQVCDLGDRGDIERQIERLVDRDVEDQLERVVSNSDIDSGCDLDVILAAEDPVHQTARITGRGNGRAVDDDSSGIALCRDTGDVDTTLVSVDLEDTLGIDHRGDLIDIVSLAFYGEFYVVGVVCADEDFARDVRYIDTLREEAQGFGGIIRLREIELHCYLLDVGCVTEVYPYRNYYSINIKYNQILNSNNGGGGLSLHLAGGSARMESMNSTQSNLKRMDNMGIVVESLDEVVAFFEELGLKLEGRAILEGEWSGRVTGLPGQRVEIAMMVTPDGHSRLELCRYLTPEPVADHRDAPVNALGYLRTMFTVEDIDDTVARLQKHGAKLVGEIVQYENTYRLCYMRGPEQILIGLAEELNG